MRKSFNFSLLGFNFLLEKSKKANMFKIEIIIRYTSLGLYDPQIQNRTQGLLCNDKMLRMATLSFPHCDFKGRCDWWWLLLPVC